MIARRRERLPEFRGRRDHPATVITATVNDWGAIAWSPRRVRRGHASARIWRFSIASAAATVSLPADLRPAQPATREAVEYGAAHGALAMTTPGDTSAARLAEVRRLVEGRSARVQR